MRTGPDRRAQRRSVLVGAALVLAVTPLPPAAASEGTTSVAGSRFKPAVTGQDAAVSTESPIATDAAFAVLDQGGTAADAVWAATFTMGVVRPESCGIGGGGFMTYRSGRGEVATLDFREAAPASPAYVYSPGVLGYPGTGRAVVGVPGVVAGADAALSRFGNPDMSRSQILEHAIRAAREGFPTALSQRANLRDGFHRSRFFVMSGLSEEWYEHDPSKTGYEAYQPKTYQTLPGVAAALERLAQEGWRDFYDGRLSDRIVATLAKVTGREALGDLSVMTKQDLERYRAIWRTPVVSHYRDAQVIGMGMPSSGGIAVAEMLNILERYDVAAAGFGSARHLHLLAEAQKLAWADRNAFVGDPATVPNAEALQRELASDGYAETRRLDESQAAGDVPAGSPQASSSTSPASVATEGSNTTHISVIDKEGNAAAVTCSLEQPFGSAVSVPVDGDRGFLLNSQLTDFDTDPTAANGWASGKRPRSSMSPTIVVNDGVPVLVTGAQGGPKIIGGVAQAVVNTVDFGMDVAHAVDAPRVDARAYFFAGPPCRDGQASASRLEVRALDVEDARLAPAVLAALRDMGHRLRCLGEYAVYVDDVEKQAVFGAPTLTAVSGGRGLSRSAFTDPRTSDNSATDVGMADVRRTATGGSAHG